MLSGMRHRSQLFLSLTAAALTAAAVPALAQQAESPPATQPPTPSPQAAPAPPAAPDLPAAKDHPVTKSQVPPDSPAARAKLLDDLYAHLATAEDQIHAQPIVDAIERMWLYSGSDTVAVLMDRAHAAIAAKRYDLALKLLDAVVDLAPDFAEGWNRRAYAYFAQNDFGRALGDLRRVLALEPSHFKALDGLGQILKEMGQKKAALKAFKQVLEVNPNFPGARQNVEELQRELEGQGI